MVTITWKILRVDNYQTLTDSTGAVFEDVIYALQWEIRATELIDQVDPDTGEIYQQPGASAWIYDVVGIDIDLSAAYTPRSAVTEQELVDWVQEKLGPEAVDALEARLLEMLANLTSGSESSP